MSACVLDTDVVIAALDRRDSHHGAAARGLRRLMRTRTPRLLSLVNYAEALVRPAEDEQTLPTAVKAIEALGISLIAPTPAIARQAARLRAHGISLADGFALATAQTHDAAIATFDRRVRRAADVIGVAHAAAVG